MLTTKQILEIVGECFGADKYHFGAAQYERFARAIERAAREAAIEEARQAAVIHSQYPITTDFDRGYDAGSKDAGARIRALKQREGL
jgi:hypothetical protein